MTHQNVQVYRPDLCQALIALLCQSCAVFSVLQTDGAEKQEAGFPVH